jgi:RNA polymerase sigma-54 factor
MALELRQNLKLSQQLVMTPQLQQAIKLLQLSRIELIETINQELESNPVLEEAGLDDRMDGSEEDKVAEDSDVPSLASSDDASTPWDKKAVEEENWREYFDTDISKTAINAYSFEQKDAPDYENFVSSTTDLTDHLMWQLQMGDYSEEEFTVGSLIIGNIDSSGYFKASVEDIASEAGVDVEFVEQVLKRIQKFDPVGVGARDLRECLLIQLEHLGLDDDLPEIMVRNHMDAIERHNYQAIARAVKRPVEDVVKAFDIITALEPRPGRSMSQDNTHYIVPDIYVYKVDDEYVVSMNDEGLPELRISSLYRQVAKNSETGGETKEFLQDKIRSAQWLIKSIQQRKKTIFKVTESIVKFQREFLDKGVTHLKPLILRDVAEDVDMHESTISRVTTNKYVHTPQGIFELKFFFSTGLPGGSCGDVAAQSVKERIKKLIDSEDKSKPYSDKQLMEILAKDNIKIARRTVAKYREQLGILPSSRRKRPKI